MGLSQMRMAYGAPKSVASADAVQACQGVDEGGGKEVAYLRGWYPAIFLIKRVEFQEGVRNLADADALVFHAFREPWHGQLEPVLHLHLGDVAVNGGIEGEAHAHASFGTGSRVDVEKLVEARHAQLDDLGYGVLHGFC